MTLDHEFPTPTTEELVVKWQEYAGGQAVEAPGVFGALTLPGEPPRAYASLDLCEVVRNTHLGLRSLLVCDGEQYTGNIHRYGEGTVISHPDDIRSLAQLAMANGLVEPVKGIDEIVDISRSWREKGVFVMANTSTLPGCELSTIEFFRRHLPGVFQGLLLPRNHDGTLPLTKGHAAANVVKAVPPAPGYGVVAVHIDDSPHHNVAFRDQVGGFASSRVATFQPAYPSHLPPDEGSVLTPTPLDAFRAADQFFAEQLARQAA